MRFRLLLSVILVVVFAPAAFAGSITGVFQGTVVQLPASRTAAKTRWMYVQGKNGAIRRANIARAVFEYDDDYPAARRRKHPEDSLARAVEVRVTAEQDEAKDGEWQATNVLILAPRKPAGPHVKTASAAPVLSRRQD